MACERALRQAEVACQVNPQSGTFLSVLGAALYRVAQYEQATLTLHRAEQALHEELGHGHAGNLAFLAMSLHHLGRLDESQAVLSRLRALMQAPPTPPLGERNYNFFSTTFLYEAEALIGDGAGSDEGPD